MVPCRPCHKSQPCLHRDLPQTRGHVGLQAPQETCIAKIDEKLLKTSIIYHIYTYTLRNRMIEKTTFILGFGSFFSCKMAVSLTQAWPQGQASSSGAENAVAAYRYGSGHAGPALREVWPLYDASAFGQS